MIDRYFRGMGIQRKIMLLLMGVAVFSFLALGLISFASLWQVREGALRMGGAMGESVAVSSEDYALRKAKDHLLVVARERSARVEAKLNDVLTDARNLADMTESLMANHERYRTRELTTPHEPLVPGLTPYIYYPRGAKERIMSDPSLSYKVGILANIGENLELVARYYDRETSCYIASEMGCMIWVDSVGTGNEMLEYPKFYLDGSYDSKERPWYLKAKLAGKPVITDVYVSTEGEAEITCAAPYYENDVFAGVAGVSTPSSVLYQLVLGNNKADGSMQFALDEKGCVAVYSREDGTWLAGEGDDDGPRQHFDQWMTPSENTDNALKAMLAGETGTAMVVGADGREYVLAYAPMPSIGWSYGILTEREKIVDPAQELKEDVLARTRNYAESMQQLFLKNIAIMTVVLFFLMLGISALSLKASKKFVQPLLLLTAGVKKIATGNLDEKLQVSTGDELNTLAESVNDMTQDLKNYMEDLSSVTAEKERIATELSLANGIQEGMLPHTFPAYPERKEIDLYASMAAAREVGGDFYDFYLLNDHLLAITIADVSGKGIGAALFMVISKTIIKNEALALSSASEVGEVDWSRVVARTNLQLCENNEEMMFVTVFFGVLDLGTGEFFYVNGGHNPPLIGRAEGERMRWQYLRHEKKSNMVGVLEDADYKMEKLLMSPGDMIYLYTDGVTEAMDGEANLYTEMRLQETLEQRTTPASSATEVLSVIREDIETHVRGAEQSDDITMLGLKYVGQSSSLRAEDTAEENWRRYEAKKEALGNILEDILAEAGLAEVAPAQQIKLELGVEEIVLNIITYAYRNGGFIWTRTSVRGNVFQLEIADHGRPFNPLVKESCDSEGMSVEEWEKNGYGIFLVKKNFSAVRYSYEELFGKMTNRLTLELQK